MWYLIAFWMIGTPMQHIEPVEQFETRALCESYVEAVLPEFDIVVYENLSRIAWDNGVKDDFGIMCMTRAVES